MIKNKLSYLVATCLTFATFSASYAQQILLQNATILDGRATVEPYVGSILLKDGVIKKVSKKTIVVGKDVETLDCTGKFITPGLFEAHIHLSTMDLTDMQKARAYTDVILKSMITHGITTVRDMVGNAPYLAQYKREIMEGVKQGPDIFYAAQFSGPGYFEMFSTGTKIRLGTSPWERAVADSTDIPKVVREAKESGVTAIKTYAELSKETLAKIVKAAKKENLLVWSHATIFPIKPTVAVAQSVRSISHAADVIFEQLPGDSIDISDAWQQVYKGMKVDSKKLQPLFAEMKKRDVYFDPTVFHALNNKMNHAVDITKMAHEAGVKIVCGTDWIYPEDDAMVPLYDEARIYKDDVGMSALEVLETLTYNAALVTGLKDRGYIAPKLRADVLVLDADPRQDIINLFKPSVVIQKGKIISLHTSWVGL